MITVFTGKVSQHKVHSLNESNQLHTQVSASAKTGTLAQYNINSPEELSQLFQQLTPYQSIISGVFPYDKFTTDNRRVKENAQVNNPWYKMDGDYNINCEALSIDILAQGDPQFKNVRYLELNSSSNIILPDGTPHNQHKKGIWIQFNSTDNAEIKIYINILFKRLTLLGYSKYIPSTSDKSYAIYLRSVIDTAVFSPERISFEAKPECKEGVKHNSLYNAKEGEFLNPTLIKPLTSMEEAQYLQIVQKLTKDIAPQVQKKKAFVKANYPKYYERQKEHSQGGYLTTNLVDNDNNEIPNPALDGILLDIHKSLRDPIDPDYGKDKAKIFINDDGSMYLHSLAHGSHSYRLLFEAKQVLDSEIFNTWQEKSKITKSDKREVRQLLEGIAPRMLYTILDIELLAEELPLSKPVIKNLLEDKAVSREYEEAKQQTKKIEGLYKMLESGHAPMLSLDPETGINSLSSSGFVRVLDNPLAVKILTETADRVNGFGMYYNTPYKKLNLWGGFTVEPSSRQISKEDIAPFLYLIALITDHEYHKKNPSKDFSLTEYPRTENQDTKYLLDWFADLIQDPLRSNDLRTSIHITGINRTGESVLSFLIASFFAPYNRKTIDSGEQLFTRFNSFLSHTVFVQSEEVRFNGTYYEQFKSLTASPYLDVEMKGVDGTTQVPNCVRIFQTSNNMASREDIADTRTTVFNILPKHIQDKKWFEKIHKWWDKGGKELTFTYLSKRKFNTQDITSSLQNKSTIESKISNLDEANRYGMSLLKDKDKLPLGLASKVFSDFELKYQSKYYVASNKLTKELKKMFTAYDGEEAFYKHNNNYFIDPELGRQVIAGRLGCEWFELETVLIKNDIFEGEE
jgi:hypothetical protein